MILWPKFSLLAILNVINQSVSPRMKHSEHSTQAAAWATDAPRVQTSDSNQFSFQALEVLK